jgi:hypothetical protein
MSFDVTTDPWMTSGNTWGTVHALFLHSVVTIRSGGLLSDVQGTSAQEPL